MISYANVPLGGLNDPEGRLAGLLRDYWHLHGVREFDHPGYLVSGIHHLPIPPAPKRTCPKPGVLVWPTGASRWAEYHQIVTGDQLAAVTAAVGPDSPTSRTLLITDGTTSVTPQMWMLPPRPIGRAVGADYYLLSLVDQRYFWWQPQQGSYQWPAGDFPPSWSSLIFSLLNYANVSPSIPTIPAAYGTPSPTRWSVGNKPIPLIVDAACTTIGLRLIVSFSGAVVINNAAAAIASDASQWGTYSPSLTGGRATIAQIALSVPVRVNIQFPGNPPDGTFVYLSSLGLAEYGTAAGVGQATAIVGADLSAGSTPSAEANYARQAAVDYYQWAESRTDATWGGVVPWVNTGLEDRVEVDHSDKIYTRVLRATTTDQNVYLDNPGSPAIYANPPPGLSYPFDTPAFPVAQFFIIQGNFSFGGLQFGVVLPLGKYWVQASVMFETTGLLPYSAGYEVGTLFAFWDGVTLPVAGSTQCYDQRFTTTPVPNEAVGNYWEVTMSAVVIAPGGKYLCPFYWVQGGTVNAGIRQTWAMSVNELFQM